MKQNSIIPQNFMEKDLELLDQSIYMDSNIDQKKKTILQSFLIQNNNMNKSNMNSNNMNKSNMNSNNMNNSNMNSNNMNNKNKKNNNKKQKNI